MQQDKSEALGQAKIPRLLISMALPAVAAQLINVLYNIVDRIYIGNIPEIGTLALTGVGVTFPVLMIISAFSAFVGMGGAPLASIRLGEQDKEGAERILGNSVTVLLCLSVVLTCGLMAFKTPILYAFGASENSIGYADAYLSIYLVGTVFVQLALGLNTFISAQGFARTAMCSVLIGAVINIVLDPVFIFVFGWGVQGAAIATVLSQAVSACWVLRFLTGPKSLLHIRLGTMRLQPHIVGSIAMLGVSPFIMQSTESLVSITLNAGLQAYGGDLYVGSMTIMMSVMQLIVMPINGFAQGAQPIISYNYGAGHQERVKATFKLLLRITLTFSTLAWLLVLLFPQLFAHLFTQNAELVALTSRMMRVFLFGIFAFGAQMACQTTFLALGQAKISLFLALLRKILLLVPLALLLPRFFGVEGIYFAEPIADILAALTTTTIFLFTYQKILKQRSDQLSAPPAEKPEP